MILYATAAELAVLAALLLGPLSIALARAKWLDRAPRTGVALWQAFGVSALLAGIGSGLCIAVERYHNGFFGGVGRLADGLTGGHPLQGLGVPDALGLTLVADLAIVLVCLVGSVIVRTIRSRARLRRLVDLVARRTPDGIAVLDHPGAVAYCVPGVRPRIVISEGTIELLNEPELHAVVAHERGHASEGHGLVLLPFVSLRKVVTFLPYTRLAGPSVAGLLEMAADDYAAQREDSRTLASALVSMSTSGARPTCALGLTDGSICRRVERLARTRRGSSRLALGAALAAVGLLALPLVLVTVS